MGQDEGFFVKVPDLLDTLRLEPMNEKTALRRLEGFRPLLKREVEIDSFLLYDGWDDPRTLWDFDYEKFPNASTGFVFFRNPRNKRQLSPSYSLSSLLELPKKLANSLVTVSLIRQVSASVSKESGGILDCNAFGGVERLSSGKCEVSVDARLKLVMSAGEVLVLRVDVPATRAANTRVEL